MSESSNAVHHAACLFGGALFSAGIASAQPTFTPQTIGNSAYIAEDLFPVDLDGDGDVDLIGATTAGGNGIKIPWFENNGANPPSFTQRTVYAGAGYVRSVFPADFDDDGLIDILAHINDEIFWFKNAGNGTFSRNIQGTYGAGAFSISSVFAADIDGDGRTDMVWTNKDTGQVCWSRRAGGEFSAGCTPINFGTTPNMRDVFCIDFDHDGDIDLISASDAGVRVAINEPCGPNCDFTILIIDPAPAHAVYAADIDLDGDTDIAAIVEVDVGDPELGLTLRLYPNTESGFIIGSVWRYQTASDVLMVDLDSDLDPDLAIAGTSVLQQYGYFENGQYLDEFRLGEALWSVVSPAGGRSLAAADMDGDGDTDLVRAIGGQFQVLYNNGAAPFRRPTRNLSRVTVDEQFTNAINRANPNDFLSISSPGINDIPNLVFSLGAPPQFPQSTLSLQAVGDFDRPAGSLFAHNNSISAGDPRSIQVGAASIPIANRLFNMTLGGYVEVTGTSTFYGDSILTPQGSTFFVPPNGDAWLVGPTAVTLSGTTYIDPQGTIQTYGGSLTLANAPQAATTIQGSGLLTTLNTIINNQPVHLAGGTLRAGDGITNNATITSHAGTIRVGGMFFPGFGTFSSAGAYTGWGVIDADMTNDGFATILADTQITGDLTNNNTITIQSGTLTVLGALTDNGTITGDLASPRPAGRGSDNSGLFVQGDYTAGPTAQLQFPAGGTVAIAGNADIGIDRTTNFDLAATTLKLNGLEPPHPQHLEAMSTDIGPDAAGLERTTEGNFPLGTLRVGPTATTVSIVDARDNDRAGQSTPEAIYTGHLIIDAAASLITNGHTVYYQSLTLEGTVDDAANLVQIAGPCPADLAAPFGTLDIDDVLTFLLLFNQGSLQADLVQTGTLDIDDVLFFLLTFNSGCGS